MEVNMNRRAQLAAAPLALALLVTALPALPALAAPAAQPAVFAAYPAKAASASAAKKPSPKSKAKAPKRVKTTSYFTKIQVKWSKGKNANRYRLIAAKDRKLTKVVFKSKRIASREAWAHSGRIKEGGTYWVAVQSYDGAKPGQISKARKVTLKVRKTGLLNNVRVRAISTDAIQASWGGSATKATGYTVEIAHRLGGPVVKSKHIERAGAGSLVIDGLGAAGLAPGSEFVVTVVPVRLGVSRGKSRSVSGGLPFAAPATEAAFTAKVGSYNVRKSGLTDNAGRTWSQRVDLIAANISGLDLVGLQELDSVVRPGREVSDLQLLGERLGLAYAVGDKGRPCNFPTSISFLYNPEVFEVLGGCQVNSLPGDSERHVVVARMIHKASGQAFIFANTHLSNGLPNTAGTDAGSNLRRRQAAAAAKILAAANPDGLPAVLTGDFNCFGAQQANFPLAALEAAGWASADLTAPSLSATAIYNSSHSWLPALTYSGHIDRIYANAKVVARDFTLVYGPPAAQPSDHFAVWATLEVHP
jgi:endonuclease/exonuclease/phosphatase family metal-dependent hydrolase